jgi:hypothetical protein
VVALLLLVAGLLLLLWVLSLGYVLMRLHDAEEQLALHELALGHLTEPGVADHVHPGLGSPVRLLPPGA